MIIKNNNINIHHSNLNQSIKPKTDSPKVQGKSFKDLLDQSIQDQGELKFSKHANQRLMQRNIQLTETQLNQLNELTSKLKEKGSKESLLMLDNMAFIVNIKNNTVVTALVENEVEGNIFTNIDSALIAKTKQTG